MSPTTNTITNNMQALYVLRIPPSLVRSGYITDAGVVLRVDRKAPEHGGGILLMFPGDRSAAIPPDAQVHVYGFVSAARLTRVRNAESAQTGIDYSKGLR